jgi:pimeloyl-ACP methyl ester carboxylesterase
MLEARPDPRPTVLVHGAWHGAWCWAGLQAELDRRGLPSYAVDLPGHGTSPLPLGDLHGDAAHVAATIDRLVAARANDVVLVGHSYGGAVIAEAANRVAPGTIHHLVYVAAFALLDGESLIGFRQSQPRHDVALDSAVLPGDDGTSTLDIERAAAALYADADPAVATAALARVGPQPLATFGQPVAGAAARELPSTYIECTRDEAVHIEHQRVMSARCSHVVTLEADHSPFLSAPGRLADVIEPLVRRS